MLKRASIIITIILLAAVPAVSGGIGVSVGGFGVGVGVGGWGGPTVYAGAGYYAPTWGIGVGVGPVYVGEVAPVVAAPVIVQPSPVIVAPVAVQVPAVRYYSWGYAPCCGETVAPVQAQPEVQAAPAAPQAQLDANGQPAAVLPLMPKR